MKVFLIIFLFFLHSSLLLAESNLFNLVKCGILKEQLPSLAKKISSNNIKCDIKDIDCDKNLIPPDCSKLIDYKVVDSYEYLISLKNISEEERNLFIQFLVNYSKYIEKEEIQERLKKNQKEPHKQSEFQSFLLTVNKYSTIIILFSILLNIIVLYIFHKVIKNQIDLSIDDKISKFQNGLVNVNKDLNESFINHTLENNISMKALLEKINIVMELIKSQKQNNPTIEATKSYEKKYIYANSIFEDTTLYAVRIDSEKNFIGITQHLKDECIYKIETTDNLFGYVSILSDSPRFLNLPDEYLKPVCDVLNYSPGSQNRIIVIEKGKVEFINNQWHLTEKVKVRYE